MTIKRSYKSGIVLLIFMTFAFILGIYFLLQGEVILGTILPLSMVISMVIIVRGLVDNQPRIIIDKEGISATEFGDIKIFWSDIKEVSIIRRPHVGRIITFKLCDEAKYAPMLTEKQRLNQSVNETFGVSPFAINAEGLDIPPIVIHDEILKRMRNIV